MCVAGLGITGQTGPVAGWSIAANEVNPRRAHAELWLPGEGSDPRGELALSIFCLLILHSEFLKKGNASP